MSPLRVRAEERERRTLVPINHSKSLAKEEQGFTFFPPSSPSSSASSGPSILLSLAAAAAAAARAAKEGRPVKKGSIQSLHLMLSAEGGAKGREREDRGLDCTERRRRRNRPRAPPPPLERRRRVEGEGGEKGGKRS